MEEDAGIIAGFGEAKEEAEDAQLCGVPDGARAASE